MGRPVDPARHSAQRERIVGAAFTLFARDGYHGTTTDDIRRAAGIGSGTLFHYFPSKAAIMAAVVEAGTAHASARLDAAARAPDAREALRSLMATSAEEMSDPATAGFVRAVAVAMHEPVIAAALERDERVQHEGLTALVRRGQREGTIRDDRPRGDLAAWLALLVDGIVGRAIAGGLPGTPDARAAMLDELLATILDVP